MTGPQLIGPCGHSPLAARRQIPSAGDPAGANVVALTDEDLAHHGGRKQAVLHHPRRRGGRRHQ